MRHDGSSRRSAAVTKRPRVGTAAATSSSKTLFQVTTQAVRRAAGRTGMEIQEVEEQDATKERTPGRRRRGDDNDAGTDAAATGDMNGDDDALQAVEGGERAGRGQEDASQRGS